MSDIVSSKLFIGLFVIILAFFVAYPIVTGTSYSDITDGLFDSGSDNISSILFVGGNSDFKTFLKDYGKVTSADWDDLVQFNKTDYDAYDTFVIYVSDPEDMDLKSAGIMLAYSRREKNMLWMGNTPNMEFITHTHGETFIESGSVHTNNRSRGYVADMDISEPVKDLDLMLLSSRPDGSRILFTLDAGNESYAAVESCPAGKNIIYVAYDISKTPEVLDMIFATFE